jgi:hypothetical protein
MYKNGGILPALFKHQKWHMSSTICDNISLTSDLWELTFIKLIWSACGSLPQVLHMSTEDDARH